MSINNIYSFNNYKPSILNDNTKIKDNLFKKDDDLVKVINYNSMEEAKTKFIKYLKLIIRNLANNKNVFFVSLKINKKEIKPNEFYKMENEKIKQMINKNTVVKIYSILLVDREITEITNMFEFFLPNIKDSKIIKDMKTKIKKYYNENNYSKMLKRIFTLSKINGDDKTHNKIKKIFNGNLGDLYFLQNKIDDLITLIENLKEEKLQPIRHIFNKFFLESIKKVDGLVKNDFESLLHIKNIKDIPSRLKLIQNKIKSNIGNKMLEKINVKHYL